MGCRAGRSRDIIDDLAEDGLLSNPKGQVILHTGKCPPEIATSISDVISSASYHGDRDLALALTPSLSF